MKIVKSILLAILAIIAVLLVIALFLKKEYSVEKEIVINKSQQDVFSYILLLKNQDHYSKWVMMDPNVKKEYHGTDGTVGFVSAWDSENKNVGKGEQEITKITDDSRIDYEIRFIKPFEGIATAYMTTDFVAQNKTKVKWGFTGKMKYPFNLLILCMNVEKMVGDDLSTGLNNLKAVLEK
jgi:hypothetical protein